MKSRDTSPLKNHKDLEMPKKMDSDTSLTWNQPRVEEPKSGFINFSKIFNDLQDKKKKHFE
jgi:hypothetical protein